MKQKRTIKGNVRAVKQGILDFKDWVFTFPSKVKRGILDFKEWVSVFHPIIYYHELTDMYGPTRDYGAKELSMNYRFWDGKRFVSNRDRMWNRMQQKLVEFSLLRYERRLGKADWLGTYGSGWQVWISINKNHTQDYDPSACPDNPTDIDFHFEKLKDGGFRLTEERLLRDEHGHRYFEDLIYKLDDNLLLR